MPVMLDDELLTLGGRRVQRRARAVLLRRIRDDWPPGTALAPLRDLSRDMGMAYGTLRAAVASLVKAGYLVSTPRRGTFVARPLRAQDERWLLQQETQDDSPSLRLSRSLAGKVIEIRLVPTDDAFIGQMVAAFKSAALAAGATIREKQLQYDARLEGVSRSPAHLDFTRSDADAAALFNVMSPVTPRAGRPLVVVGTGVRNDIRALEGYDLVTVDQEHGSRLAAHWLRTRGCRRPAFLGVAKRVGGGIQWNPTSLVRYEAFCAAWGASEVPMLHASAYSVRMAALMAKDFQGLSPRPDALFAASDELAVGFLLGHDAHGRLTDRALHIVGFDGQERARTLHGETFTSVAVPTQQMGEAAAELLISRMQNPALAVRRVHVGCALMDEGR